MKIQINLTDSRYDLERFASRKELEKLLAGFDGIELMHLEEDRSGIVTADMVVGYHMIFPEYWLDFWRGDLKKCIEEFDTSEKVFDHYGGNTPEALINKFRKEYANAVSYGAEYAVIHVSDAGIFEEITGKYKYSDEDVIRGFSELVNEALKCSDETGKKELKIPGGQENGLRSSGTGKEIPWLLMENLWQPGLNFKDPDITAMLMESVYYPKKGIMLDTGHMMHTEPGLKTQKEAVRFIHKKLDEHKEICRYIRGVHLNQSLTGPVMRRIAKNPPAPAKTYEERVDQLFDYVFRVDHHKPFVGKGVEELIRRIAPEYMTFEFISNNLEEHKRMIRRQQAAFT